MGDNAGITEIPASEKQGKAPENLHTLQFTLQRGPRRPLGDAPTALLWGSDNITNMPCKHYSGNLMLNLIF